jgi:hypothetical protein
MKRKVTFVMSILKVDYLVLLIFLISYSLAPKIEICLEYFLLQGLRLFEGFWPS